MAYRTLDERFLGRPQIIVMPHATVECVEVDELSESERGDGGFGSSGR